MRKYLLYVLLGFVFLLHSCDKPPQTNVPNPIPDSTLGGVFILNEGLFTQGNASLGFIDYGLRKTYDDVFEAKNKRKLGDVLQSMTIINGKAYLVINNSNKIEVMNPRTFESLGTISGLRSPRYISKVGNSKIYVSDLYDNKITVINLLTNDIIGKINLLGWSEEMLSVSGKTYVTNVKTKSIAIIDENTDQIVDSISTPFAPKSLVLDSANTLWVLCGDINATDKRHYLLHIDLKNKTILNQWPINTPNTAASKLKINKMANTLFWIDEGVYKMSIYDKQLPTTPVIEKNKRLFYGLGVDYKYNEIFVSDAKDFNSNSDIYRYDFTGNLLGKITGGKITGDFYFYHN
jgi:hypothetical protein